MSRKRGSQVSASDEEAAQQQKALYTKWLRGSVLGGGGFNTIMVFPFGDLAPFYRDEYRKLVFSSTLAEFLATKFLNRAPDDRLGSCSWTLKEDHQASLAGIPCIVVPGWFGQPKAQWGDEADFRYSRPSIPAIQGYRRHTAFAGRSFTHERCW